MAEKTIGQAAGRPTPRAAHGDGHEDYRPYRRGYMYGFIEAVELMRRGVPFAEINAHADKVERWRDGGFRQTGNEPPRFEGGA